MLKLENVREGMKIESKTERSNLKCEVCIKGRNREPDEKANVPLEHVHTDFAGPIEPTAKHGFRLVYCSIH